MLSPTNYGQSIRKCIIAFGTLFNNIELYRRDESGNIIKKFKVPLKYCSKDKLIQRNISRPDLENDGDLQYSIPRMGFLINNISYDNSRKLNIIQKINSTNKNDGTSDIYFSPMPCSISLELNILTKTNDEALEILEKILPYFQPSFYVTIDVSDGFDERRDLVFTLKSVNFRDEFEGGFENTRLILYSLQFEAKTFILSNSADNSALIKKVITNIYTGISSTSNKKTLNISIKATKDYNGDSAIDSLDDDLVSKEDDYDVISVWDENYE